MRILFKDVDVIVTFDQKGRELINAWLLVDGTRISSLGSEEPPVNQVDEVIDCRGKIMIPGMVNLHHHMYQSLFRCVPDVQNAPLFKWLTYLYEKWKNIDEEAVYISTIIACTELLRSGCTLTSDHLYLFPPNSEHFIDAQVEAARKVGIRFYVTRGSMSLSKEQGGLPPREVVQTEEQILDDSERVILKYHDSSPGAMVRVALAPCSPFSVTERLMLETAKLAHRYKVLLHTHLAETIDEERFCKEKFKCRPVEYLRRVGWLSHNVWVAHLIHVQEEEILELAKAKVGVAHCPSSNMITGAGIAPVATMLDYGVSVGLGVDGSSANDMSNIIREARQAMLLARIKDGPEAMSARQALQLATVGGAKVLHWDDELGTLEPGKCADITLFQTNGFEWAGVVDPVAGLIRCDVNKADLVMVNGQILIKNSELVQGELHELLENHRMRTKQLNH